MQKIHIISIGGAVMHNIAIQLANQGHEVTGSDDLIFDPSKTRLAEHGLLPETMGWDPTRIHSGLDYIVLGMHAKKDNPELKKALELGIPIYSFPAFIRTKAQQKRIVVAGSHGKTTTTSMIVHLMKSLQVTSDYLIGAKIEGLSDVVQFNDQPYFVIEGDEYPSSAIDLRSKFMHYDPHYLIITGIAWDHMNVFPTYDVYYKAFQKLIESLSPETVVIYNAEDTEVVRLMQEYAKGIKIPYRTMPYDVSDGRLFLEGEFPLNIVGQHNVSNFTAAITLCEQLGMDRSLLLEAASKFGGASRRLELISSTDKGQVYLDFAHAPSKVKASVSAVKEISKSTKVLAVLELHTYSSLNADFLPQYAHTLDKADVAIVMFDPEIVANKNMKSLSFEDIKAGFQRNDLIIINSRSDLERELQKIFTSLQSEKLNMIFMSSGSFGGGNIKSLIAGRN